MISCDAPCQYDRPALPTQHTQRRSAPTKSVRMARGGEEGKEQGLGRGSRKGIGIGCRKVRIIFWSFESFASA